MAEQKDWRRGVWIAFLMGVGNIAGWYYFADALQLHYQHYIGAPFLALGLIGFWLMWRERRQA